MTQHTALSNASAHTRNQPPTWRQRVQATVVCAGLWTGSVVLAAEPAPLPTNPPVPVFGAQMFNGRFAGQSFSGFNPEYQIAPGDKVQVRLWGTFTLDTTQTVDAQGNIFLPSLGPVRVQGVRTGERAPGVGSVSAPVVVDGEVVGAVGISGPLGRLGDDPGPRYGPAVLRAARSVAAALTASSRR